MNVQQVMTPNPECCLSEDSAQSVAKIMSESNVGAIPVVSDHDSRRLIGIATDRDLCCSVIAMGLDPAGTAIGQFMKAKPVTCRPAEDIESCERAMQKHQVRRIPVVDEQGSCIGIVAQSDLAMALDPQRLYQTVAEISRTRVVAA